MKNLLVILGPTATGKTDLAISLAKKFNGEIVAADSRQVYKGLDIGTGKLPSDPTCEVKRIGPRRSHWEVGGVNIWMYDVVTINKQYTVADYVEDANQVIGQISKEKKLPIVVGGTGLYLKALLEGLSNLSVPVNEKLRGELEKLSLLELQQRLKALSLTRWKQLNQSDKQNKRRLVRAIEISFLSLRGAQATKQSQEKIAALPSVARNDVLRIGLTAPRETLYKEADLRVLDWIDHGIIDEAKKLKKQTSSKRLKELGLEYSVLVDYLDGQITENTLVKTIQGKIHGYIRRQQTWFKKEKEVHWFDITDPHYINNVEMLITSWYHGHHDKKN